MNYEVEKAKNELYKILENNPELREYQQKLNEAMDGVDEKDRLKVLATFLQYNLSDLKFELLQLQSLLNKL